MKLRDYIGEVGDKAAAGMFRVSPRTTRSWRLGYRAPRTDKAKEIEKVTLGLVKFEDCY